MGEFRPGHAVVFRSRAERLRAIAARLAAQAELMEAGREQAFLLGQAREFEDSADRLEADAAQIDGIWTLAARLEGRTVFVAEAPRGNDADARAGRVRLSY